MKRSKSGDPAHDVLGYERQQLDTIFRPETVAVIGAYPSGLGAWGARSCGTS